MMKGLSKDRLKILIVEDDEIDRVLLARMLGQCGIAEADMQTATDLTIALQDLAAETFDVVLLDMGLQDHADRPILDLIRDCWPHASIVAILDTDDEQQGADAVARGVDDYFIKDKSNAHHLKRSIHYAVERKGFLRALWESMRKYQVIFDNASEGILVTNTQTLQILYANPAICQMLGYRREELLTLRVPQLHPEASMQDILSAFREMGESIRIQGRDIPFRTKTGDVIYTDINSAEAAIDGEAMCVAFVVDVTDRKRSEKTLRESERGYRMLFEQMLDGCAVHETILDGEGRPVDYRFLSVNPAFESMTGLRAADLVGRTAREVLPALEPSWIQRYGQVALTGEPALFDDYACELQKHFHVTAFRPAPNQFACIFADVTDRVRTEAALRQTADDIERVNALTADLELRMTALRQEVNELLAQAGQPARYHCVRQDSGPVQPGRPLDS